MSRKKSTSDPRSPIVIERNCHMDDEKLLLYQVYEKKHKEEMDDTIKSLHAAWDLLYDVHKKEKTLKEENEELQKQLNDAEIRIDKYKKKYGNLLEDEECVEEETHKETESSDGKWFMASAVLIGAAIFGGCYYLKR